MCSQGTSKPLLREKLCKVTTDDIVGLLDELQNPSQNMPEQHSNHFIPFMTP